MARIWAWTEMTHGLSTLHGSMYTELKRMVMNARNPMHGRHVSIVCLMSLGLCMHQKRIGIVIGYTKLVAWNEVQSIVPDIRNLTRPEDIRSIHERRQPTKDIVCMTDNANPSLHSGLLRRCTPCTQRPGT